MDNQSLETENKELRSRLKEVRDYIENEMVNDRAGGDEGLSRYELLKILNGKKES